MGRRGFEERFQVLVYYVGGEELGLWTGMLDGWSDGAQ